MSLPLPRLLLVEDDPVSRAYLCEALRALARVEPAANAAEAVSRAAGSAHALLLVDLQLPDGDGRELLPRLRALGATGPAVALTADASQQLDGALAAAGFAAIAYKPLAPAALRELVAAQLGRAAVGTMPANGVAEPDPAPTAAVGRAGPAGTAADRNEPAGAAPDGNEAAVDREEAASPAAELDETAGPTADWHEAAALSAAGGRPDIVAALRRLLLADLPEQRAAVRAALGRGDAAAAQSVLHRLQAACGFCGARRLERAARALDRALAGGSAGAAAGEQDFNDACDALLSGTGVL